MALPCEIPGSTDRLHEAGFLYIYANLIEKLEDFYEETINLLQIDINSTAFLELQLATSDEYFNVTIEEVEEADRIMRDDDENLMAQICQRMTKAKMRPLLLSVETNFPEKKVKRTNMIYIIGSNQLIQSSQVLKEADPNDKPDYEELIQAEAAEMGMTCKEYRRFFLI